MGDIAEIIGRLEKASESSDELDADIWVATGGNSCNPLTGHWNGKKCWWETTRHERHGKNETTHMKAHTAPPYTASIDAALTIVPEGFYVEMRRHFDGWYAWVAEHSKFRDATPDVGYQKPAAISLCIAALRAREKQ